MTTTPSPDESPSAAWRFPNRATPPGSSAYYSIRLAAAERRDALAALFAWRHEVCAVVEEVSDPGVARIKLDWWRSEIERTLAGEPRHPLSQALTGSAAVTRLPQQPFVDIITTTSDTLSGRRHADRAAQRHSDECDLGALFELIARCEAGDDAELLQTARRAGGWCAQVRRIRDAGWLLRRGRELLPADQLDAEGLTQSALSSDPGWRRLPQLLQRLAAGLRAEALPPAQAGRLSPALRVQLRLHQDLLDVLERSAVDVADQRIRLTPLRKLWLAWRATR